MSNTAYLALANAAVWLGIGGYCFFLAKKNKLLQTRLERLEYLTQEQNKDT